MAVATPSDSVRAQFLKRSGELDEIPPQVGHSQLAKFGDSSGLQFMFRPGTGRFQGDSHLRQAHDLGSCVGWVGYLLDVVPCFQFPNQLTDRLLGDSGLLRQGGGTGASCIHQEQEACEGRRHVAETATSNLGHHGGGQGAASGTQDRGEIVFF
jgi:hypothetical protein